MDQFSNLSASNSPYMEDQFLKFEADPSSVTLEWRTFFESLNAGYDMVSKSKNGGNIQTAKATVASSSQNGVTRLIEAYRNHGHFNAHINPLSDNADVRKDLNISRFGLNESMMNDLFDTDSLIDKETATLKEIIDILKATYTNKIGVQYQSIPSHKERFWLGHKMESTQNNPNYDATTKKRILKGLLSADNFENFLHKKYVGKKRFSGEGADSIIPMLDTMINYCGEHGISDVVVGMAHRGRLNVMVNIFEKPFEEIFAAFDESLVINDEIASSDVKYHMGKSYDVKTRNGHNVHMSLLNNPSHLEIVNPVVAGSVRAKQNHKGKDGYKKVIPLIIHGDSAFAGQGVVPETLNLANLEGYTNKGTMHIIINNQIGFTARPEDVFSGEYCTDIARMLQVPIFHVNGDDPEACNHVMEMAMEYRNKFQKDVFIDLVCYRKYGHNEGDDPTFTSPVMYKKIKAHKSPYHLYKSKLISEGTISDAETKNMENDYNKILTDAFERSRSNETKVKPDMFGGAWENFSKEALKEPKTEITTEQLKKIADSYISYPKDFTPNKKIHKAMEKRKSMLEGTNKIDWGAGEVTAYAALLEEGFSIRLSGQDVRRGTFSHRHVALWDSETGEQYMPISKLAKSETALQVWNSSLSELAVLGFEFGYSLASPGTLTIWEAQFGDFSNGAQIVIDQFISSSEQKWDRMSGLVLLLPHASEGMGPEHSSARPERYLQLCAQENMTVANATTPAQIFHLLRRQALRKMRRPLVVFTPKSLLRHPMATSTIDELTSGNFQHVIDDDKANVDKVTKIVFCTGKFYYELISEQTENTAIVRVEQLYPAPVESIKKLITKYSKTKKFIWAQEEPKNQGFWTFIRENLSDELEQPLICISRDAAASPAVGSSKRHASEQAKLIKKIFA